MAPSSTAESGLVPVNGTPEPFSGSQEWSLPNSTPSAVPQPATESRGNTFIDPELLLGHKEPLPYRGSLDEFESFDVTPISGREFPQASLAQWLRAPNSDELIRDLAVTISQRGVVFFRAQNEMTVELQKELAKRLGQLSGKPSTSGLHIFPFVYGAEDRDKEVTIITHEDKPIEKGKVHARLQDPKTTPPHKMWHSDSTFEHVPADYAVLRFEKLPSTGGDTVWASGYEVYDRLSGPLKAFFGGLTFTGGQPAYHKKAATNGTPYYTDQRGAPENVGKHIRAIHPVVRTNPVTGWNSIYALGHHVEYINHVSPAESTKLLEWLHDIVVLNHDIHIRHRWVNNNDMALWDNRCMVHTATPDYLGKGLGDRKGCRVMSIGERPYHDPSASGRAESLVL
ncbi:related to taurine catabolism dioxygenase [Rhynchosporium secalis]|uniref:Related to taurine catabolism dioxygenase n=1 Tax=Rhynchosporium secalis TaxID=38038 RepID=A0A1E1M492_RHYSE|nr:related to taurine catabolism dioxygenase [Rhynchosporium secalis]